MKYFIFMLLLAFSVVKADTVGIDMDMWVADESGEVINNDNEFDVTGTQEIILSSVSQENLDNIPFATILKSTPSKIEEPKIVESVKSVSSDEVLRKETVVKKEVVAKEIVLSKVEPSTYTTKKASIQKSNTVSTVKKIPQKELVVLLKEDFIGFIRPIVEFIKFNPSQFVSLIMFIAFLIYFMFFKPIVNRVKNSTNFSPQSA